MNYLFDTNIVIHYVRQSPLFYETEARYDPFGPANRPLLSVIAVGEIKSFAIQSRWGKTRMAELERLFKKFIILNVRYKVIDDRYAEIDAFSQGKLFHLPLAGTSRNMGKNDLWIAATASVLGAKLLTTDNDFDHLNGVFLDVEKMIWP